MILPKETLRYGEATGDALVVRTGHPSNRRKVRRGQHAHRAARSGVWAGYMVCWMVVVAVSLFLASRQMTLARLGYQIEAAQKELALAQRDTEHLRYQVSQLESLTRVEAAARSLGMVPAKQRTAEFTPAGSAVATSTSGKAVQSRTAAQTKSGLLSSLARAVLTAIGKQAEASPGRLRNPERLPTDHGQVRPPW